MAGMKVLIAGATGALGRPLVRELIERGHTVYGLTRTQGNSDSLTRAGATPIFADAMDRDALLASLREVQVDVVVHALTALKKPPLHYSGLEQTNHLRTEGTTNLLAAARACGARRFVAESMHVGYGLGDWGDTEITEATPFAPPGRNAGMERINAAFRSIEGQVNQATAEGWIEGISLRFGAFYGPTSVADYVARLRRRQFPLVGGGTAVMHWIYIDDAARATAAALEKGAPGQAYNIADDEPVTWHDFIGRMAEAFQVPRPLSLPRSVVALFAPYGVEFMTSRVRVSTARAKQELDWTPQVPTYREGLALVAERYGATAGRNPANRSDSSPSTG